MKNKLMICVFIIFGISILLNVYFIKSINSNNKYIEQLLRIRMENDFTSIQSILNNKYDFAKSILIKDLNTHRKLMKMRFKRELGITPEIDSLIRIENAKE
jgi:hypothetical protein